MLSDPGLRSTYDAQRPMPRPGAGSPTRPGFAPSGPAPAAVRTAATPIARLCGTLDMLEARGIARPHANGLIDLYVTAEEARGGGVAAISLPLTISCPTCGGIAGPNSVWCRRCQFQGSVVEEVTLCVPIPAHAADGLLFNLELERLGDLPPMAVRIRVA